MSGEESHRFQLLARQEANRLRQLVFQGLDGMADVLLGSLSRHVLQQLDADLRVLVVHDGTGIDELPGQSLVVRLPVQVDRHNAPLHQIPHHRLFLLRVLHLGGIDDTVTEIVAGNPPKFLQHPGDGILQLLHLGRQVARQEDVHLYGTVRFPEQRPGGFGQRVTPVVRDVRLPVQATAPQVQHRQDGYHLPPLQPRALEAPHRQPQEEENEGQEINHVPESNDAPGHRFVMIADAPKLYHRLYVFKSANLSGKSQPRIQQESNRHGIEDSHNRIVRQGRGPDAGGNVDAGQEQQSDIRPDDPAPINMPGGLRQDARANRVNDRREHGQHD